MEALLVSLQQSRGFDVFCDVKVQAVDYNYSMYKYL
jgi:hypothetical protein